MDKIYNFVGVIKQNNAYLLAVCYKCFKYRPFGYHRRACNKQANYPKDKNLSYIVDSCIGYKMDSCI